VLEVSGTYREIGYQIGRHLAEIIQLVISRRSAWHQGLMAVLDSPAGRRRSQELLRLTARHFPHLLEEIRGMAEGAGLAFDAMWAMTIKSELGALDAPNPGCSTLHYRDRRRSWLAHNEDGHAAYARIMAVVRATPPSGVRFVSMVYPGILTGNGPSLNSRGVVQTTNYIGSVHSAVGLPRYVIGRAILEARSLDEAVQIATLEPRAYPYHHNLASLEDGRSLSVETVPGAHDTHEPTGLYVHTNHLILDGTDAYPHQDEQYRGTSSMSRYTVLQRRVGELVGQKVRAETLLAMLSSHQRAPYSPCRHPKGEIQGHTLGTALYDLRKGSFRLYRDNPCTAVPDESFVELVP
jgi:predicted choloylglycine hydrolase